MSSASDRAALEEALAFLGSFGRFGHLGLQRMAALMDRLGHPERRYRIFHLAGTNGKGSVAAVLSQVAREAGWRTGAYLSPHLVDPRERIRLDGRPIAPELLVAGVRLLRERIAGMEEAPTEFELWNALAFWAFAQEGIEVAVVETGLGGRLDSTNVVERPEACALVTLSFDHEAVLGRTLEAIAREKAGILKPGRPAAVGAWPPEALVVAERRARELGAPLARYGVEFRVGSVRPEPGGTWFTYEGLGVRLKDVGLALLGAHQAHNAAVALAALELAGLFPGEEPVRRALARVRWPGRLERVPGDPPLLLDGAHNPEGCAALAAALPAVAPGPRALLFGMLRDRPPEACLRPLLPVVGPVVLTAPPSPRARPAREVAAMAGVEGRARAIEDPGEALQVALELARGGTLVVAGSLYLVGFVRAWAERAGLVSPEAES